LRNWQSATEEQATTTTKQAEQEDDIYNQIKTGRNPVRNPRAGWLSAGYVGFSKFGR